MALASAGALCYDGCSSPAFSVATELHQNEDSYDSRLRLRSIDRFRDYLFRSARNRGPRRRLAYGRRDYTRPLWKNQHWPWNKKRPNLLDRWLVRAPPDSGGWPHFRLGASSDQCSGGPAHSPWDRAVQPVSGQRDVGRDRPLRCLLGRLERHCGQVRAFVRNQAIGSVGEANGGRPQAARAHNLRS
jgi:hypothetical protein